MRLACICIIAVSVWFANTLDSDGEGYMPFFGKADAKTVSEQPSDRFERGHTSTTGVHWKQMICRNRHTGKPYESDILSPEEIRHYLQKAGANDEQANILTAIAKAESGHQLNCWGDETAQYMNKRASNGQTWTESYGLFQIRTIKELSGTGDCRDVERLRNNVEQQAICAWEISNHGKNYRPWSVYLNGKYRQYL